MMNCEKKYKYINMIMVTTDLEDKELIVRFSGELQTLTEKYTGILKFKSETCVIKDLTDQPAQPILASDEQDRQVLKEFIKVLEKTYPDPREVQ